MKAMNAAPIMPCTASTRAFNVGGRLPPNAATAAPNTARMVIHSTMEPSWLPHMPISIVEQARLGGMGILVDRDHREIVDDKRVHQGGERQADQAQLRECRRTRHRHPRRRIARRADQRHQRLDQSHRQRQRQSELT